MAKLWRKRNMQLATKKKSLRAERAELLRWGVDPKHADIQELNKKIEACKAQRITHKEARTFFAAEVPAPSNLLYGIFLVSGLPTPTEFQTWFFDNLRKYREQQRTRAPGI